jgi:hypothetical protein
MMVMKEKSGFATSERQPVVNQCRIMTSPSPL